MSQHQYIGFDTETKPAFKKGEINEVALLQFAIPGKVFLIRSLMTGITSELKGFLESEDHIKIGVALRDDLKDLNRLSPMKPRGFLDLQKFVKAFHIENNGLRKITAIILGFRISKNSQVSNWEADVLDSSQIKYAATDAWVCLEIYNKLREEI